MHSEAARGKARRSARRARLRLEPLEERRLLATAVLQDGVLTINNDGTETNDFVLALTGGDLSISDNNNPVSGDTRVPFADVTKIVVNAHGGDDHLTVDISGGNPVPAGGLDYHGGDQETAAGDELVLVGGAVEATAYRIGNDGSGDIDIDGRTIRYTGLEPITSSLTAAHVSLDFQAGQDIVVRDAGGGRNLARAGTGDSLMFTSPSRLLTIDTEQTTGTAGALNIQGLAGDFHAALSIQAGEDDRVNLLGPLAVTSLSARGHEMTIQGDIQAREDVTLTARSPVTVSSNIIAAGDITVEATESAPANYDNVTILAGATVESTGGDVTIRAGDRITIQPGAAVRALASGSGDVTLESGVADVDGDGAMTLDGTINANTFNGVLTLELNAQQAATQSASGTLGGAILQLLSSTPAGSFTLDSSFSNSFTSFTAAIGGSAAYRDATNIDFGSTSVGGDLIAIATNGGISNTSGPLHVAGTARFEATGTLSPPPLTAFWDFEGGNPLLDKTGNGHDLILPGGSNNPAFAAATLSANGWMPIGLGSTAADFDGNDYLRIPGSVYSGGDFTFTVAQLRPASATGFDTLLASSRFRYQNVNNTLQGGINSPGGSFGGAYPLSVDDWHLITLRYNHATRSLESFASTNTGVLAGPVLTGIANPPGLGNSMNFRLGGDGTSLIGGFDGWAGELDFVAFHDGLLSNSQIQQMLTVFNTAAADIELGTLNPLDVGGGLELHAAGNATVVNQSDIEFQSSTIGGDLSATTVSGGITDTGSVAVSGAAQFTTSGIDQDIQLDTLAVSGPIGLRTTGSGADATIANASAIDFKTTTVSGNLTATAASGDILDSQPLSVGGMAQFTTLQADASIHLDSLLVLGQIGLSTIGGDADATIVNGGGIDFKPTSVGGDLVATAMEGNITNTGGSVTVGGATTLDATGGVRALPPLTAFWDFEGGDPTIDKTGNGHNLVLPGGANNPAFAPATASGNGWTPASLSGTVADFDGNDYLGIPNSVYSGGDFTFTVAQLRPASASGFDTLLASSRFRYQNVNNALTGAINSPGGSFGGTYPLDVDDWHLVTLRYNHATRSLESFATTNTGTLAGPVLTGAATAPGLGNSVNFRLGGDGTSLIGGFDGWTGELDFVVFQDGWLSDADIQSLLTVFDAGFTSPSIIDLGTSHPLDVNGSLTLRSMGDATVVNVSSLDFETSDVGGDLNAATTSGDIDDSGTVTVAGMARFTTSGTDFDIHLDSLAVAGTIGLQTVGGGGNATLTNATAIHFENSSVGGALSVSAASGNVTVPAGVTVSAGADVSMAAEADISLPAGAVVTAGGALHLQSDANDNGDSSVILAGSVSTLSGTFASGNSHADSFWVVPQTNSSVHVDGNPPITQPGDVLNLDMSGVTDPTLILGPAQGSGAYSFTSAHQPVSYTSIEQVDTGGVPTHLVLDMLTAGFQDGSADTIDARLNGGDIELRANGNLVYVRSVSEVLSLTVIGSADDDTFGITETAAGLPDFSGSPPPVLASQGGHLNTPFANETGFMPGDLDIHYDGRGGANDLLLTFSASHDVVYFSDELDAANSGNVGIDAPSGSAISFANLSPITFVGAGGSLLLDATATPGTSTLSVDDALPAGDGRSIVTGDGGFEDVTFSGFNSLAVRSGGGPAGELIDLISLDSLNPPASVVLDGDNAFGSDAGDDILRVRAVPPGVAVTLLGGSGDDHFQLFDAGLTVDNIAGQVQLNGEAGTDHFTLLDAGDPTGDAVLITETVIDGLTGFAGASDVSYSGIERLHVTSSAGNDALDIDMTSGGSDLVDVVVNASAGNDQVRLESFVTGPSSITLNGNSGSDTFNEPTGPADPNPNTNPRGKLEPSLTTTIFVNGDAGPTASGNPTSPSNGDIDTLNLDGTTLVAPVVVDAVAGVVTSGGPHRNVYFSGMEDLCLDDVSRDDVNVDVGQLYVRTTDFRERITYTLWNDGGVKLRIDDLDNNSSTTFAEHFGLAGGNQMLQRIVTFARDGDDLVSVAGHVVDANDAAIPVEFHGEDGNDYLTGADGDDVLVGGPGRDRVLGGEGDNSLYGDGNVLGQDGIPLESPTDGDDYVSGRAGRDAIFGGGGGDRLYGSGGDDYIHAGSGNDLVDGGLQDDVLVGADGDDTVSGNYGNDILLGGLGNDRLLGRHGDDILLGGSDKDQVRGDAGNDLVVGGNASSVNDSTSDAALRAILAEWVLGNPALPGGLGTLLTDGIEDLLLGDLGADVFHDGSGDDPEDRVYDYRASDGDLLL